MNFFTGQIFSPELIVVCKNLLPARGQVPRTFDIPIDTFKWVSLFADNNSFGLGKHSC